MKKTILLLCALLVLLLAACGKEPQTTETDTNGIAASSPDLISFAPEDWNQSSGVGSFVETPEGCYYLNFVGSEDDVIRLLYFCPRGGDTFYPLCGKPNCQHNDKNCNAYFDGSPFGFGYYDGAIYALDYSGFESKLIKLNLDGTDHSVVKTLDDIEFVTSCWYHHGMFFIYFEGDMELPPQMRESHLYVVKLSDLSVTEPVQDFASKGELLALTFYKDKVYAQFDSSPDAESNGYQWAELDTNTWESKPLPIRAEEIYATDTTLYYYEANKDYDGETIRDGKPGFRGYDLATGTVQEWDFPVEDVCNVKWGNTFIYLTACPHKGDEGETVRTVSIVTKDHRLVDQFELKEGQYLAVESSDRMYLKNYFSIIGYLDLSEFGSHHLELKPVKTVG